MEKKVDFAHECEDWDFMWIEPNDPEFEMCHCFTEMEEQLKTASEIMEKNKKVLKKLAE